MATRLSYLGEKLRKTAVTLSQAGRKVDAIASPAASPRLPTRVLSLLASATVRHELDCAASRFEQVMVSHARTMSEFLEMAPSSFDVVIVDFDFAVTGTGAEFLVALRDAVRDRTPVVLATGLRGGPMLNLPEVVGAVVPKRDGGNALLQAALRGCHHTEAASDSLDEAATVASSRRRSSFLWPYVGPDNGSLD